MTTRRSALLYANLVNGLCERCECDREHVSHVDMQWLIHDYRQPCGIARDLFGADHDKSSGSKHSSGLLSSRKPRNTGWRSFPSAVHSWKATCATKRGARWVMPFSLG